MTTLLIALNLLAFVISFGAILWAWMKVRADMVENEALLVRLEEIEQAYDHEPAELLHEKRAAQRAAGKTVVSFGDLDNMPEIVKGLIYRHALDGLGWQVALVGLGIALGTAANVLPLVVST